VLGEGGQVDAGGSRRQVFDLVLRLAFVRFASIGVGVVMALFLTVVPSVC
jgi:hypothetical protein